MSQREDDLAALVDALEAMLTHYRVGTLPSSDLLERIRTLKARVAHHARPEPERSP